MKYKDYVQQNQEGGWINLKPGDNKLRIISEFETFGRHYDNATKKAVVCIGREAGCPDCLAKQKPSVSFLVWAIDRTDNQIKLFRYGFMIHDKISALSKSEEYGFDVIPKYDMTIIKKGTGLDTEYEVLPARKDTELTAEEKEQMKEMVKPVSEVIERMKAKVMPAEVEQVSPKIKTVSYDDIPVIDSESKVNEKDLPF